jgi:nitrate/TMAO reductase-like tetraheme cytochrome c subunit
MPCLATFAVAALLAVAPVRAQDVTRPVEQAKQRWAESPHGPMLERILPPTFAPRKLPEPKSRGARLAVQYCVQCHNLPNPAMHEAQKWPGIFERMVVRMRGRGNLGELMHEMMAGVEAPTAAEAEILLAYLQKYSQRPLDPNKYPAVNLPEGQSFKLACQQCHVLPDPQRHKASEWPAIVARMEKNMEWMNRVVGNQPDPREPQLKVDEINAFLVKYARKR